MSGVSQLDAIVCQGDDNVATAVRDLPAGEQVRVSGGGVEALIELKEPVPFGHKLALREISAGEEVTKYGETIGRATTTIRQGEHVHLHNVEGLRGRGDRSRGESGREDPGGEYPDRGDPGRGDLR